MQLRELFNNNQTRFQNLKNTVNLFIPDFKGKEIILHEYCRNNY